MDRELTEVVLGACRTLKENKSHIVGEAVNGCVLTDLSDGSQMILCGGICGYVWSRIEVLGNVRYPKLRNEYNKWMKLHYQVMYPVGQNSGLIPNPATAFRRATASRMWGEGEYARLRWVFLDGMIKKLERDLDL